MAKHLHKGDERRRRWKIIDASRAGDPSVLPQLLARLDGGETSENRRHIVRALGNIGGPQAEARLLELLASERGPILGEVAQAIGKLGLRRASSMLRGLRDHESEWVRQNVGFALKQLAIRA
ncbi:HEAT repeat domain-containing protein [Tundrisphaera lichenicola]|uniref:HEAT repeat domain-containing protein n=1 Tax=Tundrisphaera lichenicola TaxID=2029860 RepID=UPI003EBFD8AD